MGTITIVGLGPGAAGHMSVETMELLQSCPQVILRTAVHPTVSELQKQNVAYSSCDDLYEQGSSFEEVYAGVTQRVLAAAAKGDVVYAVPGSPLVAEKTVVLLRQAAGERGVKLIIKPSMSFLDLAYVELGIDPIAGLRIIDAQDFGAIGEAGAYPLMITQVYSQLVASDLKIALMDNLNDDYEIYFLRNLGLPDEECRKVKLFELDRQPHIDHLTSVYVPPETFAGELQSFGEEEEDAAADELGGVDEALVTTAGFDDVDIQPLVDVMRTLREPGGCPWDREQTHASIRSNMIEEVYEYLEAVDADDTDGMREELGDVLMQIVFHARMAEEAGRFDLQDVIDEVVDKLIRRHPHVFGETKVQGVGDVLRNWETIKKEEKAERKHVLDGVTQGLPALLRAYKLQGKAAKVGFDWPDSEGVWAKVQEELGELREALANGDAQAAENELGDVLFAVVNYARHNRIEPEVALNGTNNRFANRFNYVERQVEASGRPWREFTLDELDKFWEEAKKSEK
ncbi:MAG: nucleoside triphosphate pyrophosphohydrolase [Phascolarctobacterium sp.]|uniref:nucleoside triphosphate pyrophosphohydrolase n=1 Tax=Phascolarctobacterium sp. TaxID=2049039 RepID=UPI0026DB2C57|nr:nucleoside triphosphate pyrophosphohydrolase [Phascolarctobacterium sp.]MDO4920435.1 nucleoside triphosphate pyrophosphohydrolase [Phascolarctobacterium sp.]